MGEVDAVIEKGSQKKRTERTDDCNKSLITDNLEKTVSILSYMTYRGKFFVAMQFFNAFFCVEVYKLFTLGVPEDYFNSQKGAGLLKDHPENY